MVLVLQIGSNTAYTMGSRSEQTSIPSGRSHRDFEKGGGRGTHSFSNGPCRVRDRECRSSGSHVQIDLKAQCMCVGSSCFQIGVGRFGPNQTRNGTGTIGQARGLRYSTRKKTTNRWDSDAVAMGIPQNDAGRSARGRKLAVTGGGKWIHKIGQCVSPVVNYATNGCVTVPCENWPLVKRAMGKRLTVCGGAKKDDDIISINGCNHTRYCSSNKKKPPHRRSVRPRRLEPSQDSGRSRSI